MFKLVADVERYPEFVPLCTELRINARKKNGDREELTATMGVGHQTLTDSFTTRVVLDQPNFKITATYMDGPFHHLENRWQFVAATPTSCDVQFYISYEFRSVLMGLALGPVFDKAFRRFTQAFEDRADELYGASADNTPK